MFERIKKIFLKNPIIFFSIYFLFSLKPKIEFFVPSIVVFYKYFHYGLMLWGILILLYNFKYILNFFKEKKYIVLVAFFGAVLATVLYNIQYISGESIKTSALTIFVMVIFLPAYQLLAEYQPESDIFKKIFYPSVLFKFIISLSSLIMYLLNISIFVIGENNTLYYAGVRYVELESKQFTLLLYGLYSDPNYAAVYSLTFLFLGLFLWNKIGLKTKFEKIFFSIFMLVELSVLSLSNSRGAELAFYVSIVLYFMLLIFKTIFKKEQSSITKKLKMKVAGLGITFLVLTQLFKIASFTILEQNNPTKILIINESNTFLRLSDTSEKEILKQYVDNVNEISLDLSQIKENTSLTKQDSSTEFGNGRFTIWLDAIELTTKSPFFGFGPAMQKNAAARFDELEIPEMVAGRAFHNSFVHLFFSFGALGFLILAMWFIKEYIKLSKSIINTSTEIDFIFLGTIALIVASAFLDSIFVNNDYQQMYLYFMLGYLLFQNVNIERKRELITH